MEYQELKTYLKIDVKNKIINSFFFLFFFTLCFSSITIINNHDQILLNELLFYYAYVLLFVFIQFVSILCLNKFILKKDRLFVQLIIFSLIFNIYFVNIIFIFDSTQIITELRTYLSKYIDFILLIPFYFLFYFIFSEIQGNLKFKFFCFFICITLFLSPFLLNILNYNDDIGDNKNLKIGNTIFNNSNIRKNIKLYNKPDIYLVGMDSLIPESIAKNHLDINELSYIEVLKGSYILKNSFTENFPTWGTVNGILNLDLNQFNNLIKKNNMNFPNIVSGKVSSNLIQIFKKNGYISSFYHPGYAFGWQRSSPNFDFYQTKSKKLYDGSFCNYNIFDRKFHLLGFCYLSQTLLGNEENKKSYSNFLNNIKISNSKPSLNLSFFYMPGHADSLNYDHNNKEMKEKFKIEFINNSKKVANFLKDFSKYLETNSKNYILIVYGDHGPWLSANTDFAVNPKFYIQARYAVHLSIGPKKNRCAKFISENQDEYITINKLLEKVIKCLSGSEIFIKKNNYSIIQDFKKDKDNKLSILFREKPLNFKDFLYE